MINIKNKKGETLIEVVLAVGLSVMVLFDLVVLGSASVKTSTSSSRRAEAEKLASSGVEAIRYLRDSGGFDSLSNTCYQIAPDGSSVNEIATNCTGANASSAWIAITVDGDNFDRKIEVSDYAGSSTMKKVVSSSRWIESTGDANGYRYVTISTVLSKW